MSKSAHIKGGAAIGTAEEKEHIIKMMKTDYTYPKPGDPEFQKKIYEKREFNFHKIPSREHIKTYDDVKHYRDKHCSRDFTLYSHQNFLANLFNPATDYRGLLVFMGTGSGKCLNGDQLIYINGITIKIGELFEMFADRDSLFTDKDGGEWYNPTITLNANSINEQTGKIIQMPVKQIYRQRIDEDMMTVKLTNGLSMKMTQAHMLLTSQGWQNSLSYKVGSKVALPKYLLPSDDCSLQVPDWGIGKDYESESHPTMDIEYVTISEIERFHHTGWVYDLEIDTHHNYVAQGMICHNTCGAIAIAEQFKTMVQKYGTKIHILVPGPVLKDVWKESLIKCTRETYLKYQDRTSIADEDDFGRQKKAALNTAMQFYRFMSYRSFSKRVMGERIIDRRSGDAKEKSKYRKSNGEYERDMPVDRIHNLNNTLIIVDEAHNLTGNDYGEALKEISRKSQNCRIVLLTATPMKNLADDIVELVNFIRPHDKPIEREKIFTAQAGHQMELRPTGLEYLKKMCRGYISYMRGADPITFAKRVDIGVVPPGLKFTQVISCQMYPFQRSCYDEAVKDEGDALSKKSEAVANFVVPGLSPDKKSVVGYYGREGIQLVCNQLKTQSQMLNQRIGEAMPKWLKALPECSKMSSAQINELIEGGGQDKDEWIKLAESGKTIAGRILSMPFLRLFSTKFADALDGMAERVEGKRGAMTSFSYSNLVKAGIELFQEVLQQNGYLEFDETGAYQSTPKTICHRCGKQFEGHDNSHIFRPATFITVTGKASDDVAEYIPEDKQRVIRTIFNALDNLDGRNIKFILGSRVMNEGVSLENLGEIDVLDVYFNFGRVDQVVGRGIRNCSHYKTVTDTNRYPEVKVYKFAITLGEGSREGGDYVLSSEEELYQKAELKYLLIKQVERALKEVAVDCALNRNGNIFAEEVEKHKGCVARGDCPAICDYMECDYKCDDPALNSKWLDKHGNYRNVPKAQLDYTTFGSRLARDEIDFAKERVKDMFRLTPQYKLKAIVDYVKTGYTEQQHIELFDEMFIYRALDELLPKTENDFNNFRDTLVDGYGNMGYLIHRGEYYIFQPMNQTEDVPMYYRTNFSQTMVNKLSVFNYMRHTINWDTVEKETAEPVVEQDIDGEGAKEKGGYDFESVRDYYDNREEFEIVGILDQDTGRRKSTENAADVFKIRSFRPKILDKRRGTGISSYKGSVCGTSKSSEYLEEVAKKISANIKLGDPTTSRADLCNAIRDRLIELEKYSTDNITYIIMPANHKQYKFPLNLKDRTKQTVDTLKGSMKGSTITVEKEKTTDKIIRKYTIHVKLHNGANNSANTNSDSILQEIDGAKKQADGSWIIVID